MEIRQMKPEEYSLVLENLNDVFGKAGNKIVDFTRLLPKILTAAGNVPGGITGLLMGKTWRPWWEYT